MSRSESVIHDLGYRGYEGPRLTLRAIARSLFVTGLRHAYGLGRSGRSKVLPFLLLGLVLLPAAVMVGIVAFTGMGLPVGYADYPSTMQVLVSVFAAAQAPVLFSRDLQHGSIVLYLARPLSAALFATVRWLSLTAAIALFALAPVLLLYLGALLARLDPVAQSQSAGKALVATLVLAAMLATITGVISSLSTRRGLAVVASIAVLVAGSGAVDLVQLLTLDRGSETVAQLVGLASPYSVYRGIAHVLDPAVATAGAPDSAFMAALYVLVGIAVSAIGLLLLMRRFAKVGSR